VCATSRDSERHHLEARSGQVIEQLRGAGADAGASTDERCCVEGDPHGSALISGASGDSLHVTARIESGLGQGTLDCTPLHLDLLDGEHGESDADVGEVLRSPGELAQWAVIGGCGHVRSVVGGGPDPTVRGVASPTVVTVEEPAPEPFTVAEQSPIDDPMIDGAMPAEGDEVTAPAVVVVMVTHDPGWWFEETLASIGAQTYQQVSVLVIDAGSADPDDLRTRVAAILPDAHLRRLDADLGFGPAANESITAVQGAAFHLLCHDDVRLEPGVIATLVEEAFRSNAGVVGPKIVDWSDTSRLLSVGMTTDHYGQPAPYVERGDLDQEQFDSVRDVLYLQGAVTLVRSDLFAELGGFDPEIAFHGEDLDLPLPESLISRHWASVDPWMTVDDSRPVTASARVWSPRPSGHG
jgi:Glycosyltransferase like family 2